MPKLNKLNTIALTLLITGAIDSIRNLPASALFGSTLVFFFLFSAIVFLIPTALVSAELSANINEGGIYHWARRAFGERTGFLAVWLQWINNVVWFPTILSFIAGTAAYLIDPALAQNKVYMVGSILAVFWLLTLINLRGIRISAKFTSFCAIIGLLIPMALIIILLLVWMAIGNPLQFHITNQNFFPNWSQTDNWIALTAIIMSFSGMELATVHINEVNEPKRTFPRALAISCLLILLTMILGSLAIAYVVPQNQINLVNGTIQTFSYFLSAYHLNWLTPILTCMLIIGSMGGVISWVVSPVKGMSQAAKNGFMPKFFEKENRHGMPQNLLITQAILVSIVCLAFLLMPSINGSYWLLSALSTQLYVLMYVIMFICALRLRNHFHHDKQGFTIPGDKFGLYVVCLLGLIGCAMALIVGFIPPSNINVGSKLHYEMIFIGGMLAMILPAFIFFWYQKKTMLPSEILSLNSTIVSENSNS